MKRLLIVLAASLSLIFSYAMTVQAAIEVIDFNALPEGSIPLEGIDLGDVDIFGPNSFISEGKINVWPGMVVFQFAPTLLVDEIWATVGTNNTPAIVLVFGTGGSASFSISDPWEPPTTQSISGIGYIYTLMFSGYESYISGLEYNTNAAEAQAPVPGALILFGSGLMGMLGICRKKG